MTKSWLDPRIEIRPSPIHGIGMFATRPITAGEIVIRWHGEIMPLSRLPELRQQARWDCAAFTESEIIVFDPDDPVIHGNHFCDSNLWMEGNDALSARRDIATGEEVTVDYGLVSDDDQGGEMECRCGSPLCRRLVTCLDWRRHDLQERYAGHFVPYLRERYLSLSKN